MSTSIDSLPENQQAFLYKLWSHADASGIVQTIADDFSLREDEFYLITEWAREGRFLEILHDAVQVGTVRLLIGGRA